MSKAWLEILQGLLTSLDTSATTAWREEDKKWVTEDQTWRDEDLQWREQDYSSKVAFLEHQDVQQRWREEDLNQTHVENMRALWLRFVEKNRRDVEEKSTKLKAVSEIAAVFAGFAVVSLTQLKIEETQTPLALIAIYAVTTAVTGLMSITLVSCTLLLGSILKNGKSYVDETAEEAYMKACQLFWRSYVQGARPPQPRRTFESFWETRCQPRFRLAYYSFQWGISSFLFSLFPIGWIIFNTEQTTLVSSLITLGAAFCVWTYVQFVWASHLRSQPAELVKGDARAVSMGLPYDWHLSPE